MMKLSRLFLSQNISIDNALSMNQILHQIVNQIKEIVDFINNLELRANEYTDQEILKLKNDLEGQLETLEQTLKTYTDTKINEYNEDVINPQLRVIRDTINTLDRTLNERITSEVGILNRRVDSEVSTLNRIIEDTRNYLEEMIKKGNSYVFSSISGRHTPLQNVVNEIGNVLKQVLSYNWDFIDIHKQGYFNIEQLQQYDGYTKIGDSRVLYRPISMPSYISISNTLNSITYNGDVYECIQITSSGPPISAIYDGCKINGILLNSVFPKSVFGVSGVNIPVVFLGFYNTISFGEVSTPEPKFTCLNFTTYSDTVSFKISFNSIKHAMEKLDLNFNSIVYNGVNVLNEMNNKHILYYPTGIYNDHIAEDENNYKVVHNNFNSTFFKEVENINEGE